MAFTFDSTVGGASANSYSSVAELDDYIGSLVRPGTAALAATTTPTKEKALVECTRWLERVIEDFPGSPTFSTQALRMPRTGLFTVEANLLDHLTIPLVWTEIHSELAVSIINDSETWTALSGQGIKSLGAGPLDIEFDRLDRLESFPRRVQDLLRNAFLGFDPIFTGDRVLPILRM